MSLHGCMIMLLQSKICVKNKVFQAVWMRYSILVASDSIRCHQMSHNSMFYRWICRCNFAKSEPRNGRKDAPTDHSTPQASRSNPPEVDSLFKRTEQVVSLSDKRAGESAPKSRILEEKSTNQKSHVYGENNRDKDG